MYENSYGGYRRYQRLLHNQEYTCKPWFFVGEYSGRCTLRFARRVLVLCTGCDTLRSDRQVYLDSLHLLCIQAWVRVLKWEWVKFCSKYFKICILCHFTYLGNNRCCKGLLDTLRNTGILPCDSSLYNLRWLHNCKDQHTFHFGMQELGDTLHLPRIRVLCILCTDLLCRMVGSSTLLGDFVTHKGLQCRIVLDCKHPHSFGWHICLTADILSHCCNRLKKSKTCIIDLKVD